MGFLKNLVGREVRYGIRDGISKGVSSAISGAVNKAVAPAAEKMATETAKNIEQASAGLESAAMNAATELNAAANTLAKEAEGYTTPSPFPNFYEFVPEVFPKWTCGGSEHELYRDTVCDDNGCPIVKFRCSGTELNLGRYLVLLQANGFVPNGDTWSKKVGGTYFCLDTTDACVDGAILISFYTK